MRFCSCASLARSTSGLKKLSDGDGVGDGDGGWPEALEARASVRMDGATPVGVTPAGAFVTTAASLLELLTTELPVSPEAACSAAAVGRSLVLIIMGGKAVRPLWTMILWYSISCSRRASRAARSRR